MSTIDKEIFLPNTNDFSNTAIEMITEMENKNILVIRDKNAAIEAACFNKVFYITDNEDFLKEFEKKVDDDLYGRDDNAFYFDEWNEYVEVNTDKVYNRGKRKGECVKKKILKFLFIINKIMKENNIVKFDAIIGNPPYAGQGHPLYLQILEICNKLSDNVIWLCPSQWVKNYKDSNYIKKVKTNSCKNIISHEFIGNPFDDAGLANEVAIFHFGISDKYEDYEEIRLERFKNTILARSIWKKFETYAHNIGEMTRVVLNKKKYVYASEIRGNVHESQPCWDWTTLFGEEQRNTIYETKPEGHWHFWNFKTEQECKNFIASTETDILMFALYIGKVHNKNNAITLSLIPWFGDYTHEWPEDMIQKELGLTDEEVAYIHEEMKPFGWKVVSKEST